MSTQKIIVVGGGLAGLSAAHTIIERGGNVLVLDKNSFFGGNSTKATSGINGAGTQAQANLGIPDTAAKFFADTKKSARELARDDLIKVLTHRSGDAVNWLEESFKLDLAQVARLGGHSEKRTHRGGAQFPGMTITYALMEGLEDLASSIPERVKIVKKAKVTELVVEGDRVVGVHYEKEGKTYTEHGTVILATGGYAADFTEDSLLKKYRPEYYDLPTTNGSHCEGDGHKMAMRIGARGIDLEKVQVHPTGLVDPKDPDAKVKFLAAEALRGVGGLLIDRDGKRFVDELQHRDFVTAKMWENGKFPIRLILNGQSSKEIEWHCKHYVGRGLMKKHQSGEELAKEMGIDPKVLKKTFDDHNSYAKNKGTDPFGKKFFAGGDFKLDDMYHSAVMTPVLHYTMGGLEIKPDASVVNSDNAVIQGLYAAGEIAGGVHGANRLGGSSLLGCVVFGRVAGDSASAFTLSQLSSQRAADRIGALTSHLLETKVRIDPNTRNVNLEFNWADGGAGGQGQVQTQSAQSQVPAESGPAKQGDRTAAQLESEHIPEKPTKATGGEYTREEIAKHDKDTDCWVILEDKVLDVTNFLEDHPGGAKAILLYAGREATEEFFLVHDASVLKRHGPELTIGKVKK